MNKWAILNVRFRLFPQFVGVLMSYLRYVCLFAHNSVLSILCCVFVRLSSSCVPYVASVSGLSIFYYPQYFLTFIIHKWHNFIYMYVIWFSKLIHRLIRNFLSLSYNSSSFFISRQVKYVRVPRSLVVFSHLKWLYTEMIILQTYYFHFLENISRQFLLYIIYIHLTISIYHSNIFFLNITHLM